MVQDIFLGNKLRNKIYFLHCQPVYLKMFLEPRAHFSQSHILWNEFRFSPRPRGCALLPFPCAGRAVAAQGARFSCFSQTGPCFGLALSGDSSSWRSHIPQGRVFQGGFHPACEQYGAIAGWGHFWGWGGCFFPSNTAMAQQWPHQQRWSQRVAGEAARAALTPHRHRHGHWRLTPRAHSSQAMLDIPICHQSCSMSSCLPAFVLWGKAEPRGFGHHFPTVSPHWAPSWEGFTAGFVLPWSWGVRQISATLWLLSISYFFPIAVLWFVLVFFS